MANLTNQQIKDSYQSVLTTSEVTSDPTTGVLQNGKGTPMASIEVPQLVGNAATATLATNATNATNATTAGTVTAAAQPAITSVGTLTSLSVSGALSGGIVNTTTGSDGIANGATITLFTAVRNAIYLVATMQADDPLNRKTFHIVYSQSDADVLVLSALVTGTDWAVSASGLNIQLTNTSGFTRGYRATITRIF